MIHELMKWTRGAAASSLGFVLVTFTVLSCNKDDGKPVHDPQPFTIEHSEQFPDLVIPDDNKPTVEAIALGRMLYYDPIIDKDQSRSCGECHQQAYSFSSDVAVLPHMNLGWYTNFLWEGKVMGSLEDVMLFEVEDFFPERSFFNSFSRSATSTADSSFMIK